MRVFFQFNTPMSSTPISSFLFLNKSFFLFSPLSDEFHHLHFKLYYRWFLDVCKQINRGFIKLNLNIEIIAVENKIDFLSINIILTNMNMGTLECCKNQRGNSQVKQRYIPTFVHEQIFDTQPLRPQLSRCTPTYCSTVLDTQGYNIKTVHHKAKKDLIKPNTALQKTIYCNVSHQKKIEDLYPGQHCQNYSRDNWFDHTKQQMLHSLKNGTNSGYPKERKYLDLSSDPVFTDFVYGAKGNLALSNVNLSKSCGGYCQPLCCQLVQKQIVPNPNECPAIPQPELPIEQPQLVEQLIKVQNQSKNMKAEAIHKKCQSNTQKDFHKKCIPKNERQLGLKGKNMGPRPPSEQRPKILPQNPRFTVVRKNRINRL